MNKLLIGCLALISLFFSSCQEEDFDIKNQNLNYKVEQKSFKELMNESVFNSSIRKLSKGKISKTGTYSKSEIEEQYNFTIYEELAVNVTETEKVLAYNIAIKSDSLTNENSFENLVINTDKVTNETEIHILKYNLLSEITTSEHGTPDFESTIETTPLVTNRNGTCCVNLPVRMCSYEHEHVAGPNCQNENYLFMVTLTACRECGNAGGNTDVSGTAGTSTTNTTSTSTGGGSNPIIISTPVVPVKPSPEQIVSSFVALFLNQQQQQWWNNNLNSEAVINLSIFIVKNYPMTNENTEFIKQMIDEIDNTPVNFLPSDVTLVRPTIANKITDINLYLKCFDLTQGAVFTLYVDQPTPNSNSAWSGNPLSPEGPNVGHTFLSIKQGSIRRVLGFYPGDAVDLDNPQTGGVLENNSGHDFDVSLSLPINSTQINNLINYIKSHASSNYNLNSYNCTDFGMGAASQVGLSLPSAYGTWGAPGIGSGSGDNPGQLGQNIRRLPVNSSIVKTTSTGLAQSNTGTCP